MRFFVTKYYKLPGTSGHSNERCGASAFLVNTACDSDVTRSRIICCRINIYMAITEHSFSYIFTFPTAPLVKLQYEWLGHLQPEIIHTNTQYSLKEILLRGRHTTHPFILQTSTHVAVQSVFTVKTIQHPQVRPVGTEPSSYMRRPMAHTIYKYFTRLRVNVKKRHLRVNHGNRGICANETVLKTFTLR